MARIINGQPADTPEQKRKILGVKYSENIEGDYIEGKERNERSPSNCQNNIKKRNYVENLGGEQIETWFD
ncbi:MAG: hypothetical protein KatS3mg087_0569 [Patescibacteria group bacterium]|nr:MAG: hypothetical protein KatS3mg087_0569 [Patescibacteria group bacterium]